MIRSSSTTATALRALALGALATLPALACASRTGTGMRGAATELPRTHAPRPTSAGISAADLMTRLYLFADDSMMGRQGGTEYNLKGAAYIAGELRRIGLQPAGENGTFFQDVPLARRSFDAAASSLAIGGQPLVMWTDYAPAPARGTPRSLTGARVVWGGAFGADTNAMLSRAQASGAIVLMTSTAAGMPRIRADHPLYGAAAIAFVGFESATPGMMTALRATSLAMRSGTSAATAAPAILYVTRAAAERMLGRPLDGVATGAAGQPMGGSLVMLETIVPARNVVAVLPGRDAMLKNSYVAIGAHNDHVGFNRTPVSHDSLRAFNQQEWALIGRYAGLPPLTAAQRATIAVNADSLHALRPARMDSIFNGADDDGSGSMALLEIAEAMMAAPQKPKRSVLFVWHTGEELGLLGSRHYADNPTVPRDSIITQINIDMIGRGSADDTRGGGPRYLSLVGSRRLSTQLGTLVETVNNEQRTPLAFDYGLDANGHPENIYCRSDHYSYARYGIPVVFAFTGLHADYHKVTDEPQYIDYAHYADITRYLSALTERLANLDQRPVVDQPKPDPQGACRQ